MALAVWLDYNHCVTHKKLPEASIWNSIVLRIFILLAALAYAFTVAWSRIVLGMHSYNQILFGMLLGAWLALSFHFIGYESLMKHGIDLIENKTFTGDASTRKY